VEGSLHEGKIHQGEKENVCQIEKKVHEKQRPEKKGTDSKEPADRWFTQDQ